MKERARAWAVVFSGFIIGVLTDGFRNSYGILFLEFLQEFKETKSTTAWIGSIMFGLMNFLGPVTSVLINMYGCRAVTIAGGLVSTVACISSMFGTSVYYLYVTMGLFGGIGFALLSFPFQIIIIQYFQKRRAFALGIAMCGSGIGSFAFSPLTKILIDIYGWRGTLLIEGALLLHAVPCGLVMRPPKNQENKDHVAREHNSDDTKTNQPLMPMHQNHNADQDTHNIEAGGISSNNDVTRPYTQVAARTRPKRNIKTFLNDFRQNFNIKLFKNIDFILLLISCIIEGSAYSVIFNFLPDMVVSQGYSRLDATWLLSIIAIANTVVRVPAGMLADRKFVDRRCFFVVSLCLVGATLIFIGLSKDFKLLLSLCVFYGISLGTYAILLSLVLVDVFTEKYFADTRGFTGLANGVAGLFGLPIAGALFDATGFYTLTFTVAGIEYILSGIVFSFIICHAAIKSRTSAPQTNSR